MVLFEVLGGGSTQHSAVSEMTDAVIACVAEEGAIAAGVVIVIDVQGLRDVAHAARRKAADRTHAALFA